jgi:hypothetical protein
VKEQITDMFRALESGDEKTRRHAALNLIMLVERALIPAFAEDNTDTLNSFNLLDLDVAEEEAHAILDEICRVVLNNKVPIRTRVSMVGLLGRFSKIDYLKVKLRFLQANHDILDNQQAYSTLASINPVYFGQEHHSEIRAILKEYDLVEVLGALERNDENLDDAIFHMWGQIRTVGLLDELDELAHAHYLKAVLRWLEHHHRLRDDEDVSGILDSMPSACFEKVSGDEVESLVRECNTLEIFNKLECRTYDDFRQEMDRDCPEELRFILEEDESEKSKNRLEAEKHKAHLRKAIERFREHMGGRQD